MSHATRRAVTSESGGFVLADPSTWPEVLSLAQVASIYLTSEQAIQHQFKPGRNRVPKLPKPFLTYPMRWRKADVLRHLSGGRKVA